MILFAKHKRVYRLILFPGLVFYILKSFRERLSLVRWQRILQRYRQVTPQYVTSKFCNLTTCKMNTENTSYLTTIAVGFAIPITVIAVVLRLLARKVQKLYIGADDYVIIVGAVGPSAPHSRKHLNTDALQSFTIGNAVLFLFCMYGNAISGFMFADSLVFSKQIWQR